MQKKTILRRILSAILWLPVKVLSEERIRALNAKIRDYTNQSVAKASPEVRKSFHARQRTSVNK